MTEEREGEVLPLQELRLSIEKYCVQVFQITHMHESKRVYGIPILDEIRHKCRSVCHFEDIRIPDKT